MTKKSPKVKEYTHNQLIVKEKTNYKLLCTTFFYGGKRVSWIYHIIEKSISSGLSQVYGTYDDIGDAMIVFNDIVNYV